MLGASVIRFSLVRETVCHVKTIDVFFELLEDW